MSPAGFFDCPTELQDEILSYLPSSSPPTLQGLQLGLTCKALYEILRPVILKIQVEQLREATETSNLQINRLDPSPTTHSQAAPLEFKSNDYDSNWRSIRSSSDDIIHRLFHPSKSRDLEHDFGITYMVRSISSAVEEMWCLHSLLSRSQRFRRIRFYFSGAPFKAEAETVGCQWTRAFLKLLEVCAEQPGMEITVTDSGFGGCTRSKPLFAQDGTVQPALQPIDFDFPCETFTTSRLSLLGLSGEEGAFSPLNYTFLHNLALQSSSTLTRLHLNLCPTPPDDWRAMLSGWRFSQLSHFSIRQSNVPFAVLVSFLRCHPTLTNVSLWVHHIDTQSTTALIDEKFLPNARQMVTSPSLLIPILSSSLLSSSSSTGSRKKSDVDIFPALEDLTISQEHDYLRGRNAALKFEDISKVLSMIAARTCNTTLPKLHTLSIRTVYQAQRAFEGWLRGAIGLRATPADIPSSSSSNAAAADYASYPISNLPLHGIPEFHISAYPSPYYDKMFDLCTVPTMNVDPSLVVDFIAHLFGDCHGGSAGLKKTVLSDIFTGCSGMRIDRGRVIWRETDMFPRAVERIWERCGDLEEVRCLGFGRYDLRVEKVWKRPPGPP